MGSHEEQEDLLEYATAVFGEKFTNGSIISESRKSAGEFLGDSLISHVDIIPQEKADHLDPASYNNYEEYIKAQHRLWLDEEIQGDFNGTKWRISLGEKIREHLFFQNLLKTLRGTILGFDGIFIQLERVTKGLKTDDHPYKLNLLGSLLALISEARITVVAKELDGSEKVSFIIGNG